MNWERMNLWLKGGLAGAVLSFIIVVFGISLIAALQDDCGHYAAPGFTCVAFAFVVGVGIYFIWVFIPSSIIGAILGRYFGKWWSWGKFSRLFNKIKLLFKWMFHLRWRWILAVTLMDALLILFRGGVLGDCQMGCSWYDEIARWVILLLSLYILLFPAVRLVLLLFRKRSSRK
ncbi:hypothetical protein HYV84_04765 [Candidatus Woesearchaeota archaeon]|nr:hypothetical protein [Candidatus Woesearchaeota archaeon]